MATIHIVYDPKDKITGLPLETLKQIGAKQAVMSLPDNLTKAQLGDFAVALTMLLLKGMIDG